jgi:DNA-binding CsgD family transcriptional regulator
MYVELGPDFFPEIDDTSITSAIAINAVAEVSSSNDKRLTPILVEELDFLSRGFSTHGREEYGVSFEAVRTRRKIAKRKIGARTMHHAVVMAIQEGYISINESSEEADVKLTPMENAVIRLAALGWSSDEIANNYKIHPDTVRRHYEHTRAKLDVRNLSHAMRRIFEVGILKVGEPISYPREINEAEINMLHLGLGDNVASVKELGIMHPHELEILSLLPGLKSGFFTRADMYKLGFYEDAHTPRARALAYGRAIASVSRKLEKIYSEPIIENIGRRNRRYAIRKPLRVGPAHDLKQTPIFTERYKPLQKNKPESQPLKPEQPKQQAQSPKETKNRRPSSKGHGVKVFAN